MWKDKVRRLLDGSTAVEMYRRRNARKVIDTWNGRLPVPHAVKSRRVIEVARRFGCTSLIETGTWLGEMVQATIQVFDSIHTIELSPLYASRCRDRFSNRPKVRVYEGDSAVLLPQILDQVRARALIWLDAHWSGGLTAMAAEKSPIVQELRWISSHPRHCILIDDAHQFVGAGGYPAMDELHALVGATFPRHSITVQNDIIEILPTQDA